MTGAPHDRGRDGEPLTATGADHRLGSSEPDVPVEPAEASGRSANPAPDVGERRLDARVVRQWQIGILMWAGLAAAGALLVLTVAAPLGGWSWGLAAGVAVAAIGLVAMRLPPARYRAWAFRMRERDLFVRRGVLWRTTSVIPYARIQHVDTRRGPPERWLGLASLIVYTAGVRGADVTIPGLAREEAEALRERLARLGGGEDAV